MDELTDYRAILLDEHEPPCLSLYQPTHRHAPDNQQDPIRYRNLVKALEDTLRQTYPRSEVDRLLEPFRALPSDHEFWTHTLDGIAVLGARGFFRAYRLPHRVPELAAVADTFHTKPLLRVAQRAGRYQILALDRREVRLYEGDRDALKQVKLASGVPRTITDALGEELTEPRTNVASLGEGGPTGGGVRHGQGSKSDEVEIDVERFFRFVDRAIDEHHSRRSHLPLLLAALPEYHAVFRAVSHNPFLMKEGIEADPSSLSLGELHERAWRVVESRDLARVARRAEEFGTARAKGLGSGEPVDIARATVEGRVGTLLIDAERHLPGRIDEWTGEIMPSERGEQAASDLLDDLGELVLKRGGEVMVVPGERMPTDSGAAAIFRF
jgi:hypothetical protein